MVLKEGDSERRSRSVGGGQLVLETHEFDVFLGRGKQANSRPGNTYFRKLAAEYSLEYIGASSSDTKNMIAKRIALRVDDKGGRFLRPVTAANSKGESVRAWEIISEDMRLTKVKQAMRDAASTIKRKRKEESATSDYFLTNTLHQLNGLETSKSPSSCRVRIEF